jgi:hypothetical protein
MDLSGELIKDDEAKVHILISQQEECILDWQSQSTAIPVLFTNVHDNMVRQDWAVR